MTYVEENTKKLEELKKLPYETLNKMRKEIKNNPNSTRADIINICVACGEIEIEQGIGRTYTIEEIRKEFNLEKCKSKI
ncbi:MAG: hypothetical protein Q4G09_06775 [Clostridia bacterium]|nr:hypothetical protein [Clostridia bacterium]